MAVGRPGQGARRVTARPIVCSRDRTVVALASGRSRNASSTYLATRSGVRTFSGSSGRCRAATHPHIGVTTDSRADAASQVCSPAFPATSRTDGRTCAHTSAETDRGRYRRTYAHTSVGTPSGHDGSTAVTRPPRPGRDRSCRPSVVRSVMTHPPG